MHVKVNISKEPFKTIDHHQTNHAKLPSNHLIYVLINATTVYVHLVVLTSILNCNNLCNVQDGIKLLFTLLYL